MEETGLQVAQITVTLTAMPDGDLVNTITTPNDQPANYMTYLAMLEMAKTQLPELYGN